MKKGSKKRKTSLTLHAKYSKKEKRTKGTRVGHKKGKELWWSETD